MLLEIVLLDYEPYWRSAGSHKHARHLIGSLKRARLVEHERPFLAHQRHGIPGRLERAPSG